MPYSTWPIYESENDRLRRQLAEIEEDERRKVRRQVDAEHAEYLRGKIRAKGHKPVCCVDSH